MTDEQAAALRWAAEQTKGAVCMKSEQMLSLLAEREALRAALQWFIDDIDGTHTVMRDFDDNVTRARAALSGSAAP